MPTQVARKLFRLLLRVRCEYRHAQIPLVGVVGFQAKPVLDVRPQLLEAFRGRQGALDAAEVARRSSEGFRALRQAQQQLSVLRGSEEETREALRAWFYLCDAWSHRLQQGGPHPSTSNSSSSTSSGSSSSSGPQQQPAAERAAAGTQAAPAQLLQLAAALEEGSLLVERLYEANHLSLEFGDEEQEQAQEQEAGGGSEPGAGPGPGPQDAAAGSEGSAAEDVEAPAPAPVHLPAALLAPAALAARRRLDGLAAAVATAHPGLFPSAAATSSSSSSSSSSTTTTSTGASSSSSSASSAGAGTGGCAPEAGVGSRGAAAEAPESLLRRQLAAVSHTLFHELKFKHEPVEWVYDGLAPALLPQVITRRRGVPLSLAVLYCAVCRRLGLAAAPVKAGSGGAPGVAEGPASLHGLPPDVAARQAGRTVALAPSPDCWLVAAVAAAVPAATAGAATAAAAAPFQPAAAGAGAPAHGLGQQREVRGPEDRGREDRGREGGAPEGLEVVLVDMDRRGRLMTPAEAVARFPDLQPPQQPQQAGPQQAAAQQAAAALLPLLAAAAGSGPLPLWGELSRLVLTAHTRRGESDLVAHWLVQVLALDHRAPEWAVMAPPA
ncbi:hypothetical protein HXX76_006790 [Chlamydomonas incerta]|uniref:Protein SirB1 N-terminal domain-containing protein n=1 Tax=Chlamydomonas incerta TaxID=51695 RepID=A0A835TER3_CHLIN|nr:hypothetical protein HXX76_006790 [Chlamydomonas incerta]|eukprot:KAG2436490.1 hypothetical protein HXX76_006790 [Chlamydomonas incerta]